MQTLSLWGFDIHRASSPNFSIVMVGISSDVLYWRFSNYLKLLLV
jgi:hypothetical protein